MDVFGFASVLLDPTYFFQNTRHNGKSTLSEKYSIRFATVYSKLSCVVVQYMYIKHF